MEVVWRDAEVSTIRSRDTELTPQRVYVFLMVVDSSTLHHMISGCRMSTIGPNQEIEIHFNLRLSIRGIAATSFTHGSLLKPSFLGTKVGPSQFVIEEELHIGRFLQFVEQSIVQC